MIFSRKHQKKKEGSSSTVYDSPSPPIAFLSRRKNEEMKRSVLKSNLKNALIKHNGSTCHPEVIEAICALSNLNFSLSSVNHEDVKADDENSSNCLLDLLLGEFYTLSCPSFPGRVVSTTGGDNNLVQCTLGRLSFNMFQPTSLLCTVRSVRNVVSSRKTSNIGNNKGMDSNVDSLSYDFIMDITIHIPDRDNLSAYLLNESYCYRSSQRQHQDDRMKVCFTGSTLMPSQDVLLDDNKMILWNNTFNQRAYQKAQKELSLVDTLVNSFTKRLLGITLSTTTNPSSYCLRLDFKRELHGHFDVLYIDKEIRITRGNRGTIVVLDRLIPSTTNT